jgi:ABC-type multidrug transport system permease subunit
VVRLSFYLVTAGSIREGMDEMLTILAALGGLVLGVPLASFPFMMVYAIAYSIFLTIFPWLPQNPSAHQILISNLCVYVLWCVAWTLLAKSARAPKWLLAFLFTVPLPSIWIMHAWQLSG